MAHELAHLVIYQRFSVTPSDRREYWKHEMLADDFAAALLLPSSAIPIIDAEVDVLARTALHEVPQLALRGATTLSTAARRFCELNADVTMFGVCRDNRGRATVRFSTLPGRAMVGTILRGDGTLSKLLNNPCAVRGAAIPIALGVESSDPHSEKATVVARHIEGTLLVAIASRGSRHIDAATLLGLDAEYLRKKTRRR